MELTPEEVFALINTDNQFPIDFDVAWKWVGYNQKSDAKKILEATFDEGFDFSGEFLKNSRRGRPQEKIFLSVDCFKQFCMVAGTEKGKEVRRYFLNCETELKRRIEEERNQFKPDKQQVLMAAMVSQDVVSRKPKFDEDFYAMIYRLYGRGLKNHDPKSNARSPLVALLTNKLVYDRMLGGVASGGVKDTLNKVNPRRESGTRKDKHHWHFKELGRFHLETHIYAVKAIANIIPDGRWDLFMQMIERAFPNDAPLQLTLWSIHEQLEMELLKGLPESN
jgi:phage anti-repressor protein